MVPWYPKAILSIAAALGLALAIVRPLREWAFRVDIRRLIAFHLTRFVGIYFLYLYSRHELPYDFAVRGGIGDIIVATIALALLFAVRFRPAIVAWNLLCLADIVAVVVTAARSEMAVPGSMHHLDQFPLILLPTFVVPVIIVTHVLMLLRSVRDVPAFRQ